VTYRHAVQLNITDTPEECATSTFMVEDGGNMCLQTFITINQLIQHKIPEDSNLHKYQNKRPQFSKSRHQITALQYVTKINSATSAHFTALLLTYCSRK
jgi:hypothetical protein